MRGTKKGSEVGGWLGYSQVRTGKAAIVTDAVERFTATSFGGESREIGAEELRYLFGFWTVQAPPARGAGAAE